MTLREHLQTILVHKNPAVGYAAAKCLQEDIMLQFFVNIIAKVNKNLSVLLVELTSRSRFPRLNFMSTSKTKIESKQHKPAVTSSSRTPSERPTLSHQCYQTAHTFDQTRNLHKCHTTILTGQLLTSLFIFKILNSI